MNPLEHTIETVVRPLHASDSRKRQIREELLAHLEALVAETGSAEAALAQFGDLGEIRHELQRSIPRLEAIVNGANFSSRSAHQIGPRLHESPRSHALRITRLTALSVLGVWWGLLLIPVIFGEAPRADLVPLLAVTAGLYPGLILLYQFLSILLGHALLHRRREAAAVLLLSLFAILCITPIAQWSGSGTFSLLDVLFELYLGVSLTVCWCALIVRKSRESNASAIAD